jgi:LPPG:FO 2-phospho-L-lactate transferase
VPMTDNRVATLVETPAGMLDFQDYFVGRRQTDAVLGVTFDGIERSTASEVALAAIADAEAVIVAPSNPIVSIGPILGVPGIAGAIRATAAPVVAISPIVGGRALKGPAASMLETLGHEVSALGVARIYEGLIDGLVIDEADRALAPAIELLGMRVLVTGTVMGDAVDRERLAREVLNFAATFERAAIS